MRLDKWLKCLLFVSIASLAMNYVSSSTGNGELPGEIVTDDSIKINSVSAGSAGRGGCFTTGDCVYRGICLLVDGTCTAPNPDPYGPPDIPHDGGCTECRGHMSAC